MNEEEDIRLGDGLYPAKALRGPVANIDAWADEHDPFVRGTTESMVWRAGLFNSQARLIRAPKISRWDDIVLWALCGFAVIGYTSSLLKIIITIGSQ